MAATVFPARTTRPNFALRAAYPRLLTVAGYAIAMAYLESAAVLYLRTIYGGIDPVGPLGALAQGVEAAFEVRGGPFPWPLYLLGVCLAAIGLTRGLTRVHSAA